MVGASREAVERAAGITEPSADINSIEIPVHGWLIPCPRAISKMRISKHTSHSLQEGVPAGSIP